MIADLDASAKDDILIGCISEWLRSRSGAGPLQQMVPKEVAGRVVHFRYKKRLGYHQHTRDARTLDHRPRSDYRVSRSH